MIPGSKIIKIGRAVSTVTVAGLWLASFLCDGQSAERGWIKQLDERHRIFEKGPFHSGAKR